MSESTSANQTYPKPWTFDEGMDEISGMGGAYELDCLRMLKAGGEWADAHRDEYDFAMFTRASALPAEMQDVMARAARGGATGAMYATVASHIIWVYRNSWEAYVDQMRERLRGELAGGTTLDKRAT